MKRWHVNVLLFAVVMIWGSTFVVVRDAMDTWPPTLFVALRFSVATVCLLPLLARSKVRTAWQASDWVVGGLLGCLLFAGYTTQTIGLDLIPAARSGFITGLNVVIVPLLGFLFWRERVRMQVLVGVGLSVWGMWILTSAGDMGAQSLLGDRLTLLCALLFAAHIVAVGRWTKGRSVWSLTFIQVATVAVLAIIVGVIFDPWPLWSWRVAIAALYLGSIGTVATLLLQTIAQRYASPTHTAMVFVLEPLFAAVFAAVFAKEQITQALLIGGGCMFAGIVLAEFPAPHRWRRRRLATLGKED